MDKLIKDGTLRLQTIESTCDIILSCNGQRLMAHKLILSIASPILRDILAKDPDSTVIILPEVNPVSMTLILNYIYTGNAVVCSKNIHEFLSLAKLLKIEVENQFNYFFEEKKESFDDLEVKKKEEEANFNKDLVNNNVVLDNTNSFEKDTKTILEQNSNKVGHKNEVPEAKSTQHELTKITDTPDKVLPTKTRKKLPNLLPLSNFSKTTQPESSKPWNLVLPSPWGPRFGDIFMEDPRKIYLGVENEVATTSQKQDSNNNIPAPPSLLQTTSAPRYIPNKLNSVIQNLYLSNTNPLETIKDLNCEGQNSSEEVLKNLLNTRKPKRPSTSEIILNLSKKSDSEWTTNNSLKDCTSTAFLSSTKVLNKTVFDTNDFPINLTQNFTKLQKDKKSVVTERPIKINTIKTDNNLDSFKDSDSLDSTNLKKVVEDTNKLVGEECKQNEQPVDRRKGSEVYFDQRDLKKKAFECVDCQKSFSQLRNYKYHRSLHEGTKEFSTECPECGKTFNDKGYLSSHMKIHRDKKEYACPNCPKRFNQRVAYNMHLRIHTGLKPHQCPTCEKSFSRKMLLKQHQRVHTGERPYSCPECGKTFADRSNMSLHARLHTGVKPYACNLCPKSFTKKHHLKTHMNFHTGLKPYSCDNCGLAFTQSSNMRTHYKKCILRKDASGSVSSEETNTS